MLCKNSNFFSGKIDNIPPPQKKGPIESSSNAGGSTTSTIDDPQSTIQASSVVDVSSIAGNVDVILLYVYDLNFSIAYLT
jgi:hypothetical protein